MLRYFRDLGAKVAQPVATRTTMLDPDCVIVDASLEDAAAPFIAGFTEETSDRCPPALMERLSILRGTLGNAIVLGAIAAADDVTAAAVTGARLPFTPAVPAETRSRPGVTP